MNFPSKLILESSFQYAKYDIPMHRTVYFSFTLIMVSNHVCDRLGCEFQRNALCNSGIQESSSKFGPLSGSLSLCKWNTSLVLTQWDGCLSMMLQMSWIPQLFEAHWKVCHSISQYSNLPDHAHGFPWLGLTDSKLTVSKFSSFVCNEELQFTISGLLR